MIININLASVCYGCRTDALRRIWLLWVH